MHYSTWAVIPGRHESVTSEVEALVAQLMEPYRETWNDKGDDYDGFWDWYQIGGRWNEDPNVWPVDHWSSEKFPFRYVSSDQTFTKQVRNPLFTGFDGSERYMVDDPDFARFVVKDLASHRGDSVVMVDYHS